jgi:hypothetical protein
MMKHYNKAMIVMLFAVIPCSSLFADNTPRIVGGLIPSGPTVGIDPATAIKNVGWSCQDHSHLRISATVVNKHATTMTYDVKFTGMVEGKCLSESTCPPPGSNPSATCAGVPGPCICVPECLSYAPPVPIVTKGTPVTVGANGEKPFTIIAPNNYYLKGSFVSAVRPVVGLFANTATLKPVPAGGCEMDIIH